MEQDLTASGNWPKIEYNLMYLLRTCIALLITNSYMVFAILYIRYNPNNWEENIMFSAFILMNNITNLKAFITFYKTKQFYHLIESINDDEFQPKTEQHKQLLQQRIVRMHKLHRLFMRMCFCTLISFTVGPIFDSNELALPHPFVFNLTGHWYLHKLVWFYQVLSAGIVVWNNPNYNLLPCAFISIGTGQFQILKDRMARITDGMIPDAATNVFADCYEKRIDESFKLLIGLHEKVTKYISQVESMFSVILLLQLLCTLLVVCECLFMAVAIPFGVETLHVIIFLVSAMVDPLIYCMFGNELMEESAAIVNACYSAKWDHCGSNVRKSLQIIMERSKKCSSIQAGNFITLSWSTYISMLRTSYSYFAVMRNVYSKRN